MRPVKHALLKKDALWAYKTMRLSRRLDEKMLILIRQGKSFFHIGCMGHEAIQVAAALALEKGKDWLFPYYRDQAFCIGLGMSAEECLMSFLAVGEDPNSGGRQMPQHFGHKAYNIPSSSSSTGTQYLQAVGCALANMKQQGEWAVTVVCSGEGTTSQGDFHEAISWAARENAPVIFLVENNGYAISVPIEDQRPGACVAENYTAVKGLHVLKVDGCDFAASFQVVQEAVKYARSKKGPVLLEADVVRLLPHSSSDDDKKYREKKDLEKDKKRDPLDAMRNFLIREKLATQKFIDEIDAAIFAEVEVVSDRVQAMAPPAKEEAITHVWSGAREPLLQEPRISPDAKSYVLVDAINRALSEEMAKNEAVLAFGQDIAGGKGGVFTATRGLTAQFGKARCFNAPLAESSIVGVAIGMALRKLRPVVEIQFGDYIWTAMMQIRNELATMRYRSNNHFNAPVVMRVPVGGYIHGGLCHSQNIEGTFAHFPGIKVALPSTALDAYGLLKAAIRGEDPVLFLEHKGLYRQNFAKSILPEDDDFLLPFGKAAIRREGQNLTVVSYGFLVQRALEAAAVLQDEGIEIEVIDLRTINPYDFESIALSVEKTGRLLVLYEDCRFMGFGAEIAAQVSEKCFHMLDAPVMRLAAKDSPIPYHPALEEAVLPQLSDVISAAKELANY